MDLDRLKSLIDMLKELDVAEFRYKDADMSVAVRLGGHAALPLPVAHMPVPHVSAALSPAANADDGSVLEAPMVGTFYASSKPGTPPFVEIGSRVSVGQTLCIIEAMKLMNEIEAEASGTIVARLVEDGQPVEYGQPIFRIRPG